jgi:hypothetical protein
MSKLDEELKELKRRKIKAECLANIKLNIKEATKEYKDCGKEVNEQIAAFIDAQIDMIENGSTPSMLYEAFSKSELAALKYNLKKYQK